MFLVELFFECRTSVCKTRPHFGNSALRILQLRDDWSSQYSRDSTECRLAYLLTSRCGDKLVFPSQLTPTWA